MITEDVPTLIEVQMWNEKTRQKFWKNKELLRRNIGLNTKKRILACYVFSVFTYGCDVWTNPRRFKKRYGRSKCGATGYFLRSHGQKRKNNKEMIQMVDVGEKLMKRKLGYAGHIMRGSSGPLLQLSLEGKTKGREDREGQEGTGWTM
ncbi:endonuclease-reverse transcriptase [Elysia marginata]|uniref:Endonuclease-reverse transcriptase n=1 Tax=Elysia marginata TaxID=1093978 RepID=A0AAV4I2H3_9GAST|nr:endonuclease-reverse transcriptase [Elysia marginata]